MAPASLPDRRITDVSAAESSDAPSFERLSLPDLANRYERTRHDDLNPVRGIGFGLLFGALIWAALIVGTIYLFR